MALGRADGQGDLFDDGLRFCEESLPENSIYRFLAWEREAVVPDELFCDLFSDQGRRSVPPSVVATVMVLQRLEGLSDGTRSTGMPSTLALRRRSRRARRSRWDRFAHTVLVDMQELRTSGSAGPDLRGGSAGGAGGRATRAAPGARLDAAV